MQPKKSRNGSDIIQVSNLKFIDFSLVHLIASRNEFGKSQSNIDLEADKIIFKHLKTSGVVFAAASEESPKVNEIS